MALGQLVLVQQDLLVLGRRPARCRPRPRCSRGGRRARSHRAPAVDGIAASFHGAAVVAPGALADRDRQVGLLDAGHDLREQRGLEPGGARHGRRGIGILGFEVLDDRRIVLVPQPEPIVGADVAMGLDGHRPALGERRVGRGRPGEASDQDVTSFVGPGGHPVQSWAEGCYYLYRRNQPPGRVAASGAHDDDHRSRPRKVQAWVVRRRGLRLQAQEGPERVHRPRDVGDEEGTRVDARLPAPGAPAVRAARRWPSGSPSTCPTSTSTTSTTTSSRPSGQVEDWNDLPDAIKNTYEKLGIPEAERKYLAGVTAQYESEVVFHRNREDLEALGVLFCDMDTAVREYPDLVRKYFGTIIPPNDNKFAALNSAVWSGGSFIYVPPGRQRGSAPAGLLPDQRREHGPVRADADHRRRGFSGALHRGLLGPGVHHRLAPLRGGRAGGPARDRGSPTPPSRTGRTTSTTW